MSYCKKIFNLERGKHFFKKILSRPEDIQEIMEKEVCQKNVKTVRFYLLAS